MNRRARVLTDEGMTEEVCSASNYKRGISEHRNEEKVRQPCVLVSSPPQVGDGLHTLRKMTLTNSLYHIKTK